MALSLTPPAHAAAFLAAAGHPDATVRGLAGDASFRRYFRVTSRGQSFVLMDAPPHQEDSRPFVAIARHLDALGFAAPAILAEDHAAGLFLLGDLGDDRMAEVIAADPQREEAIYAAAIDLLLALQEYGAPEGLPPYDLAVYQREASLFVDWYAPALGLEVDPKGYADAWREALAALDQPSPVLVLRDYHAENIMLLPGGALGLLDFQDALAGHPVYDLVSLLQDARREVSPDLEARMIARYAAARTFDSAAYAILGAQRNAKILGIFTRLWKRDGKPRYLALQPRVWAYLERDLAHPALAPVADWFAASVPRSARAQAWAEHA